MAALDEAIAEEGGDSTGCGPNPADFLIELAQAAELFHTADGTGFADLDVNGHRQTLAIRGKGFRRWLARRFFQETGGPGPEALQSALNVIEPKAHFDGPERVVHDRPLRGDRRVVDDRQPVRGSPPPAISCRQDRDRAARPARRRGYAILTLPTDLRTSPKPSAPRQPTPRTPSATWRRTRP